MWARPSRPAAVSAVRLWKVERRSTLRPDPATITRSLASRSMKLAVEVERTITAVFRFSPDEAEMTVDGNCARILQLFHLSARALGPDRQCQDNRSS